MFDTNRPLATIERDLLASYYKGQTEHYSLDGN